MSVGDKLLGGLGFRRIIKENGKSFANLTKLDVAAMIEDYLGRGEARFDREALYEFLDSSPATAEIERIKRSIQEIDDICRSDSNPDGLFSECGKARLETLANDLRNS